MALYFYVFIHKYIVCMVSYIIPQKQSWCTGYSADPLRSGGGPQNLDRESQAPDQSQLDTGDLKKRRCDPPFKVRTVEGKEASELPQRMFGEICCRVYML